MDSSLIPKDTIRLIGESVGSVLSDDVVVALSNEVEYRMREILQVFTQIFFIN